MTEQAAEAAPQESQGAPQEKAETTETQETGASLLDPTPEPDRNVPAERPPWTDGVSDEDIGLIEERHWKNASDVIQSYKALEKLKGAPPEKIVALPPEDATEAELNAFYSRLGRPDDPKEYNLGDLEIAEGSIDLRDKFGEWAFKAGLNPRQATDLANTYNEFMQGTLQELETEFTTNVNADMKDLRREYGADFDAAKTRGTMAAREFGVTQEQLGALERAWGTKEMFYLFERIGAKLGELPGPTGEREQSGDPFIMSPERAQQEIRRLMSDSDTQRRYLEGDPDLKNRMARLHRLAHPDAPTE